LDNGTSGADGEALLKYRLRNGNETAELEVAEQGAQSVRFTIGERDYQVEYRVISPNHLYLLVNGKAANVYLAQSTEGKSIFLRGRTYLLEDADKIERRKTRSLPEDLPGAVTPPMPAIVVKILVEAGARVTRGQGLVVVSAMKMETTLAAPSDGIVHKINTTTGAKVAPGEILVEIKAEQITNE
jgi:3-methylcrotonyl-CoA carboxylase alpha subunit